ncbi:MAG: hypothetical protein AAGI52_06510 [Bacteroidota bacterium]
MLTLFNLLPETGSSRFDGTTVHYAIHTDPHWVLAQARAGRFDLDMDSSTALERALLAEPQADASQGSGATEPVTPVTDQLAAMQELTQALEHIQKAQRLLQGDKVLARQLLTVFDGQATIIDALKENLERISPPS